MFLVVCSPRLVVVCSTGICAVDRFEHRQISGDPAGYDLDDGDIRRLRNCRSGTTKIQIQLLGQSSNAAVGTFAWKDLPGLVVSGTKWTATIPGLPVGGEYKVRFRAVNGSAVTDSSPVIEHVLVGDVWLCSGQSNMQQEPGTKLDTANVHTRVIWSSQPGTTETSPWGTTITKGPSTSFGNSLHTLIDIPIGLIYAAKGGTSITDWYYSRDSTGNNLFTRMSDFLQKGAGGWKIAGFLWYQGENEDQQDTWAQRYFVKFGRMRDTIRLLSRNPKLPVVAVQLESWDGTSLFPLDPYSRWIRWPIIRDQQELIGRADAYSAAAPIWPAAGLHIDAAHQAALGTYCAAIATRKFYQSLAADPGAGPIFKAAWFKDSTRESIVVQFDGVKGRLVNPADKNHLGFYVMKPDVFDINDSTIFDYETDSYGKPAKMLEAIGSIDTLGSDKIVIRLAAAAKDSVTVGYGRHIQLVSLSPLTDASGIPVLTFFNRPIASAVATSSAKPAPSSAAHRRLSIVGSTVVVDQAEAGAHPEISVYDLEGRMLMRRKLSGDSMDLRGLRMNGALIVTGKFGNEIESIRLCTFDGI